MKKPQSRPTGEAEKILREASPAKASIEFVATLLVGVALVRLGQVVKKSVRWRGLRASSACISESREGIQQKLERLWFELRSMWLETTRERATAESKD